MGNTMGTIQTATTELLLTWRMSSDTETSDTWKPVLLLLLPRLLLLVDLKSTHISPEPWRAHAQ